MNKHAAQKIAQEYYAIGVKLAFEQAGIKLADPQVSKEDKKLQDYLVGGPSPSVKKNKSKPTSSKSPLGDLSIGKMKLPEDKLMDNFDQVALANPGVKGLPRNKKVYGLTVTGRF